MGGMRLVIDSETVETVELHVGSLKIPLSREQTFEMLFGSDYSVVSTEKLERLLHKQKRRSVDRLPATREPQAKLLPPAPTKARKRKSKRDYEMKPETRESVTKAYATLQDKLGRMPSCEEMSKKLGVTDSTIQHQMRRLGLKWYTPPRPKHPSIPHAMKVHAKLTAKLGRPPTNREFWGAVDQKLCTSEGNTWQIANNHNLPLTPARTIAKNGAADAQA